MKRSPATISEVLHDPLLSIDKKLPVDTELKIQKYLDLLVKWNNKINLTAEKDPDSILKKHVFDSLQYLRTLDSASRVMDIGSGAGFPGIPLRIIYPEITLVLVESQRKRCSFLETVVRELELDRVEVLNARAEDLPVEHEGRYGKVVFRAVSSLKSCLILGERFLEPGGTLIVKKPPNETLCQQNSNLVLKKDIPITSYQGLVSSLLIYEAVANRLG